MTVGRRCLVTLKSRSQCLVSLHEVRDVRSVTLLGHFVSYVFGFPSDSHHSAVAHPATVLTMVRGITSWAADLLLRWSHCKEDKPFVSGAYWYRVYANLCFILDFKLSLCSECRMLSSG